MSPFPSPLGEKKSVITILKLSDLKSSRETYNDFDNDGDPYY